MTETIEERRAALERSFGPFAEPSFRADLARLADSARETARRWAGDAVLLAALADRVPRESNDERGGTAWTSFEREVAIARGTSDLAARNDIYTACRLVACHPRSLQLLEAGQLTPARARALIDALRCCDDDPTVRQVDEQVADRACQLPGWRIKQEAAKALLGLDADAAAARAAEAARSRSVRRASLPDGQAEVVLTGPALPLAAWYDGLTAAARAARAAGDPRGLDALRFDLATADPLAAPAAPASRSAAGAGRTDSAHVGGEPAWRGDRRRVRPVQALIQVPVTTALGLSNEPGWLDGYGWISAPQCRELLTTAELRKACLAASGELVDTAEHVTRPDPTPQAVRDALLGMVIDPFPLTGKTHRIEPRHDPSAALAGFVQLRDRYCDGPTGTQVPAARCDLDHNVRHPDGPTAAWNLPARSRRTHALKHRGWTPLRTPTSTLWFSPAGQLVEMPRFLDPPPELDPDARLPDPEDLHALDAELTREPTHDDDPPPF